MIQLEKATRQSILEAAKACVCGDRDQLHGEPEKSLPMIAEFWDSYIKWSYVSRGDDWILSPQDVCQLMILLKIARSVCGHIHHIDNAVDIAGYAACMGELDD